MFSPSQFSNNLKVKFESVQNEPVQKLAERSCKVVTTNTACWCVHPFLILLVNLVNLLFCNSIMVTKKARLITVLKLTTDIILNLYIFH